MGPAKEVKRFTPAEYYELEGKAEFKSDYYDGEIFPSDRGGSGRLRRISARGGPRHLRIRANLIQALTRRLLPEAAYVEVPADGPDVMIRHGPPAYAESRLVA